MMNETRERFLRGILERVSPERIVEIHFFPPIRQGQLESGVAVVALESTPHAVGEHAVAAPVAEPVDAHRPSLTERRGFGASQPRLTSRAVASAASLCGLRIT